MREAGVSGLALLNIRTQYKHTGIKTCGIGPETNGLREQSPKVNSRIHDVIYVTETALWQGASGYASPRHGTLACQTL